MKTFFIIRHGETDYNRRGIVQGRGVDTDLNETGRMQAQRFYEAYAEVPFDKVYTSTLKRTHQTVQGFLDRGIPWEQLSGLDELDWGNNEGQAPDSDTMQEFYKVAEQWTEGAYETAIPGGESALDVANRQQEALQHMLSHEEEEKVLVCMHGRAMRILMCLLTGRELSEMDMFPHQNLSLYKLSYDGQKFEILDFNDLAHLYE